MSNIPKLSKTQEQEVVNLAKTMAKAAGKTSPVTMLYACMLLIETAVIYEKPEVWIEWATKLEKNQ